MQPIDLSILQCPQTHQSLRYATADEVSMANTKMNEWSLMFEQGLVSETGNWFYPVYKEIYCLHSYYAIPLVEGIANSRQMEFDKKRIFNYFNQIQYHDFEGQSIYDDAKDFVDFRPFLLPYTKHGFYNCRQYLAQSGKYFVDVACGPVAFKEYIQLAEGFECRICIDLSLNALLQAQRNLKAHGQRGIFICGDLTALPMKDGLADAVICQHALFHVQKKMQAQALKELVRIVGPGKRVAIVYDWFYHSWLMNLTLGPYQLYRIARHWAGRFYARVFKKDKLYFYAHGRSWFLRNNPGKKLDIYVWRSINIHFSRIWLHKRLGGEKIINYIWKLEKNHPGKMGRIGEYPIIVIEK
jgi:ubiquinone/menaquinone biosynthesis C-methylase UbiE/uncharacterized protein YbaR (Trm112 family)